MKILRIRLKNLNSLEGEWEIDFTHPTYLANPIFAISGPTGSGKSTLLDAICLALYGRTPRLKIISKSINEVMTRQTGECFAEVTFETLKGRFRCHWSQHRARKKPGGDLQQPRHEIVDDSDNRVLEHMIKKVATKVEEVTGMAFAQFTRSILLAQGSFAAFLLASPDERAPLLEQLTGTEIYSRISQKVHELTAQQEKSFTQLSDELAGLNLLGKDEHEALTNTLAKKKNEVAQQRHDLDMLAGQISWREKLIALKRDIQILTEKHHTALELKRSQDGQRTLLQRAKLASLLLPQHDYLAQMQQQQLQETTTITSLQSEKQELQEIIAKLRDHLIQATSAQQLAEERLEQEREIIAMVRALDVKIAAGENQQEREDNKARELMRDIDTLKEQLHATTEQRKEKERQMQKCCAYLKERQVDGSLGENLPLFREQLKQLSTLLDKQQILDQQRTEIQEKSTIYSQKVNKNKGLLKETQSVLVETEKQYRYLYETGRNIRQDYPQLTKQLEDHNHKLAQLEKLLVVHSEVEQTRLELTSLAQHRQDFRDQLSEAQQKEMEIEIKRKAQLQLISQQEEIIMLVQRVKNYEQERTMLTPGSPCPLCGATDHPYLENEDLLPADEHTENLVNAKKHLSALQEDLVEVQTTGKFLQKQLEESHKLERQAQQKLKKQDLSLSQLREQFPNLSSNDFSAELLLETEQTQRAKTLLHEKSLELEKCDQQVAELRAQLDVLGKQKTDLERTLEGEKYKLQQTREKELDLLAMSKSLGEELEQRETVLADRLTPLGFNGAARDEFDDIVEKLQIRHDLWQQQKDQEKTLKEELQKVEKKQHGQEIGVASLEKEAQLQQAVMHEMSNGLKLLNKERRTHYGAKNPDIEEKACKRQLTEVTEELEKLKEDLSVQDNRMINLQTRLDTLTMSTSRRGEQLRTEETSFWHALQEKGFGNVEEFKKAILAEQHIIELEDEFAKTDETLSQLATLLKEKKKEFQKEQSRDLTSETNENLHQQQRQRTELLQQILQEIGKIQGRLEENEKLLDQQRQKREALQAQKLEYSRWQKLDMLIGSANGKKFRNFAQGITFDIMVNHANSNLQRMTDRYILVRDPLQPLELSVVDNYRGGDIRSTQNLSGGESFLVSLALALGLSGMAGDSVRVDSFFLDEGFGTLDEETLDTALHTLAGLQQEGKMIGIISHVTMLKERLDTHIQLIPQTGGHSILKGPGIRALSSIT